MNATKNFNAGALIATRQLLAQKHVIRHTGC